jgi:hypothetical protein
VEHLEFPAKEKRMSKGKGTTSEERRRNERKRRKGRGMEGGRWGRTTAHRGITM